MRDRGGEKEKSCGKMGKLCRLYRARLGQRPAKSGKKLQEVRPFGSQRERFRAKKGRFGAKNGGKKTVFAKVRSYTACLDYLV